MFSTIESSVVANAIGISLTSLLDWATFLVLLVHKCCNDSCHFLLLQDLKKLQKCIRYLNWLITNFLFSSDKNTVFLFSYLFLLIYLKLHLSSINYKHVLVHQTAILPANSAEDLSWSFLRWVQQSCFSGNACRLTVCYNERKFYDGPNNSIFFLMWYYLLNFCIPDQIFDFESFD